MQFQNLSSFELPVNFRGKPKWLVQLWWAAQSIFIKCSPQFMYGWRRFLLRCFGADIGKGALIRPSVHIQYPWKVAIGEHSWIGDEVILYSLGEIKIGRNTVISQRSYLCTGSHDYNRKEFPIYAKPIIIGKECWIATDVYVAPGVVIGEGTVVGARSSVFNSLPPGKICFGSPAKIIKDRTTDEF